MYLNQFGCQVWISTTLPYAKENDMKLYIGIDDVFIELAEPRLLIVSVSAKLCKVVIISMHAPHQRNKEGLDWWKRIVEFFVCVQELIVHFLCQSP